MKEEWMKQWDHVPTEELIALRDTVFHLTPLLKPEAQEENLKWHKILCELVDERKRNGD